MSYGSISVTTTAILILAKNSKRQSIIIVNTDTTNKLYIGPDSSVTTSNGIEIENTGGNLTEDSGGTRVYLGDIYGVSTGTISVRYWEREGGI